MSNIGFMMPVGRNQGQQIAQANRSLQQQSQLQQQQQQQQQRQQQQQQPARRNSIASSISSISSRAGLIKERLSRSRRNETSAMLKQDNLMRAQISIGI